MAHPIEQLLDALTDVIADKVAARLGLRPIVKAVARSLLQAAEAAPEASAAPVEYLTTQQAAALLGLTTRGLEGMRAKGTGPKSHKYGGRVRYRRSDLEPK
jgi:hypothetical protein